MRRLRCRLFVGIAVTLIMTGCETENPQKSQSINKGTLYEDCIDNLIVLQWVYMNSGGMTYKRTADDKLIECNKDKR